MKKKRNRRFSSAEEQLEFEEQKLIALKKQVTEAIAYLSWLPEVIQRQEKWIERLKRERIKFPDMFQGQVNSISLAPMGQRVGNNE